MSGSRIGAVPPDHARGVRTFAGPATLKLWSYGGMPDKTHSGYFLAKRLT